MKTLTNITITALTFGIIFSTAHAGEDEKFYNVTEKGQFQYVYRQVDVALKEGVKPVTARTFYLETTRKGLLPQDLTYQEYLQLTPEEIQALLDQSPWYDMMDITATHEDYPAPAEVINEKSPATSNDLDLDLPWIIEVSLMPTDHYELPGEFDPMQPCVECQQEVPQVVTDVVKHGNGNVAASSVLTWGLEDISYSAGK